MWHPSVVNMFGEHYVRARLIFVLLVSLNVINYGKAESSCPALQRPANSDRLTCTDDFNFGSVCTFACMEGYVLVGSTTAVCDGKDGDWNKAPPACVTPEQRKYLFSLTNRMQNIARDLGSINQLVQNAEDSDSEENAVPTEDYISDDANVSETTSATEDEWTFEESEFPIEDNEAEDNTIVVPTRMHLEDSWVFEESESSIEDSAVIQPSSRSEDTWVFEESESSIEEKDVEDILTMRSNQEVDNTAQCDAPSWRKSTTLGRGKNIKKRKDGRNSKPKFEIRFERKGSRGTFIPGRTYTVTVKARKRRSAVKIRSAYFQINTSDSSCDSGRFVDTKRRARRQKKRSLSKYVVKRASVHAGCSSMAVVNETIDEAITRVKAYWKAPKDDTKCPVTLKATILGTDNQLYWDDDIVTPIDGARDEHQLLTKTLHSEGKPQWYQLDFDWF